MEKIFLPCEKKVRLELWINSTISNEFKTQIAENQLCKSSENALEISGSLQFIRKGMVM